MPKRPPSRLLVRGVQAGVLAATGLAWYMILRGQFPPVVVLLATVAATFCMLQALRLFVIRAHRRRTGHKPRGGWAALALGAVAVAILLFPYRPFSDTEQRVCMRAVTAAIVAERDPTDESAARVLESLARDDGIRYPIREQLERTSGAVRPVNPDEPPGRVAEASERLQRTCGYARPPF